MVFQVLTLQRKYVFKRGPQLHPLPSGPQWFCPYKEINALSCNASTLQNKVWCLSGRKFGNKMINYYCLSELHYETIGDNKVGYCLEVSENGIKYSIQFALLVYHEEYREEMYMCTSVLKHLLMLKFWGKVCKNRVWGSNRGVNKKLAKVGKGRVGTQGSELRLKCRKINFKEMERDMIVWWFSALFMGCFINLVIY